MELSDGSEALYSVKIFISPDGKMTNALHGHVANGSEYFCVKCGVTASLLKTQPFKIWDETRTQVIINLIIY